MTYLFSPVTIPNKSKRSLEKTITTLDANLDLLGLFLAPKRTILIHFKRKRIRSDTCSIKIDNYSIRFSDHIQHLRIFFKYQHKFNVHIDFTSAINAQTDSTFLILLVA